MQRGPVLSQVLDLITEGVNPFVGETFWTEHISEPEHYEVFLKKDPSDDLLSEAEEELLDEVFRRYGRLSRWALVELVHRLPEWKDPEGSALPIDYADILKTQNKAPEEIRAIEDELNAISQVEYYLSAR